MAKKKTKKKVTKSKSRSKKTAPKKKPAAKKKMENTVVWFELPVSSLERAVKFYSTVLGIKLEIMDMGDSKGAMFPYEDGVASGALIQSNENRPSNVGTMLYLNGGRDLSVPLQKVLAAGGKIVQEKLEIGEMGYIAIFEDTEGNHVAFHSQK